MPVVVALVVLDLACVGYFLSPAGRSRQALQRDYYQLRDQLAAKQQEVLPTRGMDQKLKQASKDIDSFYDHRLPARYSAVSDELGKIAADTGVHYSGVKYDEKDAPIEGLRKLNIEIALSGDYLQEVKFINALERDPMFFLIDGVTLGEQQGNVRLQLKLETYLRSGAAHVVKLGHRRQDEDHHRGSALAGRGDPGGACVFGRRLRTPHLRRQRHALQRSRLRPSMVARRLVAREPICCWPIRWIRLCASIC